MRRYLPTYFYICRQIPTNMEKRRDVFVAIADPTRREIINMLAQQSLNLNTIADHFNTSRPTISQHVKFLEDCGLIIIQKKGRERYCEAKFESLREVSQWVEQFQQFWTERFDSLDTYLENLQKRKNKK